VIAALVSLPHVFAFTVAIVSTSKLRILPHQHGQSERNSHAKQILQEIERSYRRLIEMEKWEQQQYNRPFADFGLFDGR
jgi:hypothetical protein